MQVPQLALNSCLFFFVSSTDWTAGHITSEDCHSQVPVWHRVVTVYFVRHSFQLKCVGF